VGGVGGWVEKEREKGKHMGVVCMRGGVGWIGDGGGGGGWGLVQEKEKKRKIAGEEINNVTTRDTSNEKCE